MGFFKVNHQITNLEPESEEYSDRLRYVVDDEGKGRWIRPLPAYATDYDEDIDY